MLPELLTLKKGQKATPLQNVIAVGAGAIGVFFLYKIVRKELQDAFKKAKDRRQWDKEKEPDKNNSYKPSQYIALADKIEDAFNMQYFNGTDEEAIYWVMRQLKNNNDWIELNKAYGDRTYYDPTSFTYVFGKPINMVKGLQLELDTNEKKKVNTILAQRGITYRI